MGTVGVPPEGEKKTAMVPCCEMCGAPGFEELLVTCSRCKIAHQHTYCMPIFQKFVPELWHCDECYILKERAVPKPGVKSRINSPPTKAKTKYLPPEVVRGLPSGVDLKSLGSSPKVTKTNSTPAGFRMHSSKFSGDIKANPRCAPSKPYHSLLRSSTNQGSSKQCNGVLRSSINLNPFSSGGNAFGTQPSKCASVIIRANPRLGPSRFGQMPSTTQDPVPSRERKNREVLREHHTGGEQAAKDSTEVLIRDNRQSSASKAVQVQGTTTSDHHVNNDSHIRPATVLERELQDDDLKLDRDLSNGPAACTAWRGCFKIVNEVAVGQFYDGLRAHPPIKVHRKAYEVSKTMPEALEFMLFPRVNLYVRLLGSDSPAVFDIALYMFPRAERYQSSYICLVEYLVMHDMVMKSCIGPADLLVFPSNLLPVESQRINGAYYLWAIFSEKLDKQVPEMPAPDAAEVVDMEIDMVGGEEIGAVTSSEDPDIPPGFKVTDKLKYRSSCHGSNN